MNYLRLIILSFMLVNLQLYAQEDQTLEEDPQEEIIYEEEHLGMGRVQLQDDRVVDIRAFDEEQLEKYRNDEDFQYHSKKRKIELSWFDRLMYRIGDFLATDNRGGILLKILLYGVAIMALLLIIFGLLRVPLRGVFGRKSEQLNVDFTELEENLNEMDFEGLIKEAVGQKKYKRAVRLLYLETLKQLTENNWIKWRVNKTSTDYYYELAGTPLVDLFSRLTLRFEHIWYGDFKVDQEVYESTEKIFRQFQQSVRRAA